MNATSKKILPFELGKITSEERLGRQTIILHFPGGANGIPLDLFADLVGVGKTALSIESIAKDAGARPGKIVPIALSADPSNLSFRLVLGLPLDFARKIVNLVMNRPHFASDTGLTSGEEGALLYALDRAGGDWLSAGGGPFVLRGILSNFKQIFDYLESDSPRCWCVTGNVSGPDFPDAPIFLWLTKPFPPPPVERFPRKTEIHARASNWPVILRVALGWSSLRIRDIQNLAPGDLVVLDGGSHPERNPGKPDVTLWAGTWKRWCRWNDSSSLEIIDPANRENTMKKHTENTQNTTSSEMIETHLLSPTGDDRGDIEVVVTAEIGHVKMTVAEAAKLLPGTIINLNRDVGPDVALKVGDTLLARGKLVEYEGTLAVEVSEVP